MASLQADHLENVPAEAATMVDHELQQSTPCFVQVGQIISTSTNTKLSGNVLQTPTDTFGHSYCDHCRYDRWSCFPQGDTDHPEKLITCPNSQPQWQQWAKTWVLLPSDPAFFHYTELLTGTRGTVLEASSHKRKWCRAHEKAGSSVAPPITMTSVQKTLQITS